MAGELELDDIEGPSQPKPFGGSIILWCNAQYIVSENNASHYQDFGLRQTLQKISGSLVLARCGCLFTFSFCSFTIQFAI